MTDGRKKLMADMSANAPGALTLLKDNASGASTPLKGNAPGPA